MKRQTVLLVVLALLLMPAMGSANPNGVGEGTFDAQCGGACHGDADMNASSMATVTVLSSEVAYEGLLTSVSIRVSNIETTTSGLLGIFLLSDLSGAEDTPADDGWTIISNSEGGTENYVEARIEAEQTEHTVTWTLRAPLEGSYALHGAIHHGGQDGSGVPFFGSSAEPSLVDVRPVPEDLPRLASSFEPPTQRHVGESTTVELVTEFVDDVRVEWRLVGGEPQPVTASKSAEASWTFEVPPSLQPVVVEWRVHLSGEGPEQTTPWFQLRSQEPAWTVDEPTAYLQSIAMLLAFMAAFMALQRRPATDDDTTKLDAFDVGGEH